MIKKVRSKSQAAHDHHSWRDQFACFMLRYAVVTMLEWKIDTFITDHYACSSHATYSVRRVSRLLVFLDDIMSEA